MNYAMGIEVNKKTRSIWNKLFVKINNRKYSIEKLEKESRIIVELRVQAKNKTEYLKSYSCENKWYK